MFSCTRLEQGDKMEIEERTCFSCASYKVCLVAKSHLKADKETQFMITTTQSMASLAKNCRYFHIAQRTGD